MVDDDPQLDVEGFKSFFDVAVERISRRMRSSPWALIPCWLDDTNRLVYVGIPQLSCDYIFDSLKTADSVRQGRPAFMELWMTHSAVVYLPSTVSSGTVPDSAASAANPVVSQDQPADMMHLERMADFRFGSDSVTVCVDLEMNNIRNYESAEFPFCSRPLTYGEFRDLMETLKSVAKVR